MFSVVTMEIAAEFLFVYTISRRDVRGLATVHRILERIRLGPISIAVFVAGTVFGLLTALTGSFRLPRRLADRGISTGRGHLRWGGDALAASAVCRSASRRSRQTRESVRARMSSMSFGGQSCHSVSTS